MGSISDADLYANTYRSIFASETDPVLLKYKDDIKDFGYMSDDVWIYQYT